MSRAAELTSGSVLVAGYGSVDASGQADRLVSRQEHQEEHPMCTGPRRRSYELLGVGPGDRVLDVGCGPGRAVAELQERGVDAIGLDISQRMIERARNRFPNGEFRAGAAEGLPFADDIFQGYRAERVYRHLEDPTTALAEAWRVLARGGRIVLVDLMPEAGLVDADDVPRTYAWAQAAADSIVNRWFCHQAGSLLVDAGFTAVAAELQSYLVTEYLEAAEAIVFAAVEAGRATPEEAHAWIAEQRRRAKAGRYFQLRPFVLWSARKP